MPAPDAGSNPQPNLSIVPKAKRSQQPNPAPLTKAQQREVSLTQALCAAGLLPEHAAALAANKAPAAFISTLKQDAENVGRKGQEAVNSTNAKEGFAADSVDAKKALMDNLRAIQAAARAEFADTQPERVKDYLVGNDLAVSRPALESNAQTLIEQAGQDRPGSINTEFIVSTTDKRTQYVQSKADQEGEKGAAKQKRKERNALIDSIRERRKKLQRAANAAYPVGKAGSAKARAIFRLPANRPYSY